MSAVLKNKSELPEGWEWIPLGKYVENHDAARIPVSTKERKKKKGNFPYYGASGVIDSIDGFTHEGEFVLIGEDGANLLARSKPIAFIAKGQFWVNNHAHVLKCKDGYPNAYFSYYINSIPLNEYVTGTAQPKLNQANLNRIPIPVAPPEQQKRIVAKIEELFSHIDAGIEALKKAKQLLKQYRQSVLKAAVTGELTKEWREANKAKLEPASQLLERILKERRQKWEEQQLEQFKAKGKMPKDVKWKEKYKEPEKAVVENLPELPDEWDWVSLDLTSEPNRALTYGVIKLGDHLENGVPVLRSSNVRHMNIELKGLKKIDPKLSDKYSRTILQGREVVITVRGTLGGVAAVPDEYRGWNVSREVVVIPAQKEFESRCLAIFIGSLPIQNWFNRNTKGIAYTGINIETLKEAPVPLVPLEEQVEIYRIVSEKLDSVSRLDEEIDTQLIKAEKNKQSVLASAFFGGI